MQTIFIVGATGLLGQTLTPYLKSLNKYHIAVHGNTQAADYKADFTQPKQTYECLNRANPNIIINLAALTNVDVCEANVQKAYQTNTAIVENIADWIKTTETACHLVQVSTDHVYGNTNSVASNSTLRHQEDLVDIVNIYALSKYAGEIAARCVDSTVLRTNFFGRSGIAVRPSFTDWLYKALHNREDVKVFTDIFFSPLSITTLVRMIALVVTYKPRGIFNVGSRLGMSKAEFAFKFAQELKLDVSCLTPVESKTITFLKANRPQDMRMDSSKFERALDLILPSTAEEIETVARHYYESI